MPASTGRDAHDSAYAEASRRGRAAGCRRRAARSATRELGAERVGPAGQMRRRPRRTARSASTTSSRRSGACVGEQLDVLWRRRTRRSPRRGSRLSTRSRRARGRVDAPSASSGTSRCGMTEVNHEPGPSTTQSASSTASTASGQAGGSSGSGATDTHPPGVVATRPGRGPRRSRRAASGRPDRPRPRCRAAPTPSAAPGPARRAAGPPGRARRPGRRAAPRAPAISRLPIAWSPSGPALRKRYCRTSAQVRPHSSSPQSAASAIRRSPGGRQLSSRAQPAATSRRRRRP